MKNTKDEDCYNEPRTNNLSKNVVMTRTITCSRCTDTYTTLKKMEMTNNKVTKNRKVDIKDKSRVSAGDDSRLFSRYNYTYIKYIKNHSTRYSMTT